MIVCEHRVPPWRDLSALGIVAKEQGSANSAIPYLASRVFY
jgi:hypothetical protein